MGCPVWLDVGLDLVRDEYLGCRGMCRVREGVGVHSHQQRTIHAGVYAVVADCLGDRQDVRARERSLAGRAAMAACTEGDAFNR